MARKHQPAASETLDEIQGAADKLGTWIQENLRVVVIAIVGILVAAGIASYVATGRVRSEEKASTALSETRNAYLSAMGAQPGSIDVPKLANEDAARRIREEYVEKFGAVADAHSGTVSGALARMEVAQLAIDDGEFERALALFDQILAEDPPSTALVRDVPVDVAGGAGSYTYFTIEVPDDANDLSFALSGGTGDADLYVRFNAWPNNTTLYDCSSWTLDNN